ncbi:glyceraldehyde 3-phosphate dehydrogenase 2-like [Platysternon megacephalum]|uniref:Glyceraldehyde 3-phosphate dehydrogenase 2-like n=1 Tax=Platysternon megacephalum TaxID=55544 RepID=A0A4D9DKT1_9SAUR|nr:glyceraldehyde 3-phosphate dehydrogenase 2-like [Platysternon megacephalum]
MGHLCSPLAIALLATSLAQRAQGSQNQAGCGKQLVSLSGRILNGQDAKAGAWPWQVSVQRHGSHICGGSLISERWVVSAAHCFNPSVANSAYRVQLGEKRIVSETPTQTFSSVKRVIPHPNYNSSTFLADIALVELEKPIAFTASISPVCLLDASVRVPAGDTCWVTGWGNIRPQVSLPPPKTLQEVQVQLIDTAACNTLYNIDPAPNIGRDPVKPDMFCAGYAKGQRDSCQGDSGGPLACEHNGTWFLMGIVSWGKGCGQPNHPGVYLRMVAYGEWIWEHVGSGSQASTMGNCTSGTNDARPCFSSFMLLFITTLLMSL